jgi:hypothetical protein
MIMTAWILAGVIAGAGASDEAPEAPHRVRVVEMRGLGWRADLHADLTPVARQNGATVWLAPKEKAETVLGASGREIFHPRPTNGREIPATIRTALRVPYVAHLERVADGPVGQATAVAYKPQIDYVDETLSVAAHCRAMDQGTLAEVAIDETRLASLTTYTISETVQPKDPKFEPATLKAQIQVPEVVRGEVEGEWLIPHGHVLLVGLGVHDATLPGGKSEPRERVAVIEPIAARATLPVAADPGATAARFDFKLMPIAARPAAPVSPMPLDAAACPARFDSRFVAAASPAPSPIAVAGHWTPSAPSGATPIVLNAPPGSPVMIVVQPAAPPTFESAPRVAFAVPAPPAPVAPLIYPVRNATARAFLPAPAVVPVPALPSRSLPTPINAQGEVVPLPPLPEEPAPEADLDSSAEPRGTPQTRPQQRGADSAPADLPPESPMAGRPWISTASRRSLFVYRAGTFPIPQGDAPASGSAVCVLPETARVELAIAEGLARAIPCATATTARAAALDTGKNGHKVHVRVHLEATARPDSTVQKAAAEAPCCGEGSGCCAKKPSDDSYCVKASGCCAEAKAKGVGACAAASFDAPRLSPPPICGFAVAHDLESHYRALFNAHRAASAAACAAAASPTVLAAPRDAGITRALHTEPAPIRPHGRITLGLSAASVSPLPVAIPGNPAVLRLPLALGLAVECKIERTPNPD